MITRASKQHTHVFLPEMDLKCAYSFCTKTFRTEKGRNSHYKSAEGQFHNHNFASSRKRKLSEYDTASHLLEGEEISSMSGTEDLDREPISFRDGDQVDDSSAFLADGGTLGILDTASEDSRFLNVPSTSVFVERYPGAAKTIGIGPNMYMQQLAADEHSESHKIAGPWYPFAGRVDWELAKWLNSSHLSMDKIDEFLRLEHVSTPLIVTRS